MRTSFRDASIYIRPFRDADSTPLFAAARESINELCTWMTWCTPGYSFEDSKAFVTQSQVGWQKGENYCFAILDLKDDSFLGSVGLSQVNRAHNVANIGIWCALPALAKGLRLPLSALSPHLLFRNFNFPDWKSLPLLITGPAFVWRKKLEPGLKASFAINLSF